MFERLSLLKRAYGGGATRSLPRDGGVEELDGDPTVGPRNCTNVSPPQRGGAVPGSPPLFSTGGPKWQDNYPERPDHPVAPNRLENVRVV